MDCPLLERIASPAELRRLPEAALAELAVELRQYLLESVSRSGGHLAAGLGVVELTIALHRVFDTPNDHLVWDTGHQAYAHKVLTGRREQLPSIRQQGGLAGFPSRDESPFDAFGVGHSSTSISAALGMAAADRLHGRKGHSIAVIGDGALTAGLAFEALNHAGASERKNLIVVLNDNAMSISPNVGALARSFARIFSARHYDQMREQGKRVLRHLPGPLTEFARRAEEHVKGMVTPGTLFEELGFHYLGPIDGHDLPELLRVLRHMRSRGGPQLLHIRTRKGKGYAPAEAEPVAYHGVGSFDPARGLEPAGAGSQPAPPTYTRVFSDWLCDMAAVDPRLVAITPAMAEGSGLTEFARRYPDRYYDVGIAEQHALTFAAGLATQGLKPVVAIYSSFLQRGYDQYIHDIALQNLPVMLAIDRAGLVGPDGATHNGAFDTAFLRCIPNTLLAAPADEAECRALLSSAYRHDGPSAVRYPRGPGPGEPPAPGLSPLPVGRARRLRRGHDLAILNFGPWLTTARHAAEVLDATLVDMRWIKPLDLDLLLELARDHQALATLEDAAVAGGAGSAVAEALTAAGCPRALLLLGHPDRWPAHASQAEQRQAWRLDVESLCQRLRHFRDENCRTNNDQLISESSARP